MVAFCFLLFAYFGDEMRVSSDENMVLVTFQHESHADGNAVIFNSLSGVHSVSMLYLPLSPKL